MEAKEVTEKEFWKIVGHGPDKSFESEEVPSVLDSYFLHATKQADDSDWVAKAAAEGPSVWRRRQNPLTRKLAETLQQDTGIALNTPAGRDLYSIAAQLLADYSGDLELLIEALERCRKSSRWQELSPWVQRKQVGVEASRLLTRRRRGNDVAEGFYDGEVPEWA